MMKYKKIQQALMVLLILLVVGLGLQSFLGPFNINILAYPVNVLSVLVILLISVVACKFFPNHRVTRFLSSGAAALSALLFIGVLSIVLGLIFQTTDAQLTDIPARLGIRAMTTYYPFVVSYLYLLVTLSFATFKRLKWELSALNIGFFLNHAGLLMVLFALGLGSVDQLHLRMRLKEGEVAHEALSQVGRKYALPFQMQLVDFRMETYLPKLAIIDTKTGKFLPEGAPEFYDIDSVSKSFQLLQYFFQQITYIDQAIPNGVGAYVAKPDNKFPPAVLLRLNDEVSGWVTCGNQQVPYQMLMLPNNRAVVMMNPEAKSYASMVRVEGDSFEFQRLIEVNKPLHWHAWSIYQSSFDDKQGKASNISIFQVIYDPWQRLTQLGLAMLILGALSLFWRNHQKN